MPGCHCVSDQRVLNSDSEQARQRYITGRFSGLFLLLLVATTTHYPLRRHSLYCRVLPSRSLLCLVPCSNASFISNIVPFLMAQIETLRS